MNALELLAAANFGNMDVLSELNDLGATTKRQILSLLDTSNKVIARTLAIPVTEVEEVVYSLRQALEAIQDDSTTPATPGEAAPGDRETKITRREPTQEEIDQETLASRMAFCKEILQSTRYTKEEAEGFMQRLSEMIPTVDLSKVSIEGSSNPVEAHFYAIQDRSYLYEGKPVDVHHLSDAMSEAPHWKKIMYRIALQFALGGGALPVLAMHVCAPSIVVLTPRSVDMFSDSLSDKKGSYEFNSKGKARRFQSAFKLVKTLATCHVFGVVHGDPSAANVVFMPTPEGTELRLTNFCNDDKYRGGLIVFKASDRRAPVERSEVTKATDVYRVGGVLREVLGMSGYTIYEPALREDPARRPTMAELRAAIEDKMKSESV